MPIAIARGAIVGWLWPTLATNDWIKPMGDGFIKMIGAITIPRDMETAITTG